MENTTPGETPNAGGGGDVNDICRGCRPASESNGNPKNIASSVNGILEGKKAHIFAGVTLKLHWCALECTRINFEQ